MFNMICRRSFLGTIGVILCGFIPTLKPIVIKHPRYPKGITLSKEEWDDVINWGYADLQESTKREILKGGWRT